MCVTLEQDVNAQERILLTELKCSCRPSACNLRAVIAGTPEAARSTRVMITQSCISDIPGTLFLILKRLKNEQLEFTLELYCNYLKLIKKDASFTV